MRRAFRTAPAAGTAALTLALAATPAPGQVEKMTRRPVEAKTAVKAQVRVQEALPLRIEIGRPAMPIAPGPVGTDRAQREALTDQFRDRFRPVLRAELHLIRTACKTSEDEQEALAEEGENVLKAVATEAAELQLLMQQGGGGVVRTLSATEEIPKGLMEAVKTALSPERAEHYRAEVEARDRAEREAQARVLVLKLDRLLGLNPDQRDRITAALAASDDRNIRSGNAAVYSNNDYLPALPDDAVVPHLDERQKATLQGVPRVHFGTSNFGMPNVPTSPNDLAGEDHPDVARAAAERAVRQQVNAFINTITRVPARAPALPRPAPAPVMRGVRP